MYGRPKLCVLNDPTSLRAGSIKRTATSSLFRIGMQIGAKKLKQKMSIPSASSLGYAL